MALTEQPQTRQLLRRTLRRRTLPSHGSAVAAPGNGGQLYSKEESIRILSSLPKKQRKPLIDDWVESGRIPCQ